MRGVATRIVLAVAVAGFIHGAPRQAEAASVSYVFSTPIDPTPTDFSLPIQLRQFDPSLGTLTSIEISYTSNIAAVMTVVNTGTNNRSATGSVYTEVKLVMTDPNNLIAQVNDISTTPQNFSVGPNKSKTLPARKAGTSDLTYSSNQALLNEFTGAGLISVTVSTTTTDHLTVNSGSASSTTQATADANGFVTYTYIAVPEPSSLVLGGIGTLGLLGYGIGRRSKSARA